MAFLFVVVMFVVKGLGSGLFFQEDQSIGRPTQLLAPGNRFRFLEGSATAKQGKVSKKSGKKGGNKGGKKGGKSKKGAGVILLSTTLSPNTTTPAPVVTTVAPVAPRPGLTPVGTVGVGSPVGAVGGFPVGGGLRLPFGAAPVGGFSVGGGLSLSNAGSTPAPACSISNVTKEPALHSNESDYPLTANAPQQLRDVQKKIWQWLFAHPLSNDTECGAKYSLETLSLLAPSCNATSEEAQSFCVDYSKAMLQNLRNQFDDGSIDPQSAVSSYYRQQQLVTAGLLAQTILPLQDLPPTTSVVEWGAVWVPAIQHWLPDVEKDGGKVFRQAMAGSMLAKEEQNSNLRKAMRGEFGNIAFNGGLLRTILKDMYKLTHDIFPATGLGDHNMDVQANRDAAGLSDNQMQATRDVLEKALQWVMVSPAVQALTPVDLLSELLICSYMIGGVDPEIVSKAYDYLVSKQKQDGSFGLDPRLEENGRTRNQAERHAVIVSGWALRLRAEELSRAHDTITLPAQDTTTLPAQDATTLPPPENR